MKTKKNILELKMMPLNTVLTAPPLEANEFALNVFDENELNIDPEEELVSGTFY